jgi:MFS transporter, UMF1 family
VNDKRQVFGWAMYDWANSAYVTTVSVAVLPIYFADVVVGPDGWTFMGRTFDSATLWGFMMSFAAFWVFLFAPMLGAISDFSAAKKRFLFVFCYSGAIFASLLAFCGPGDVLRTMTLFTLAQIGFVGGNVFYDAFLPHIASDDTMDWISGKGFAYGYIGGGIQFALSLGIIVGHKALGIGPDTAARIAIAFAALWWGGFAIITFRLLRENDPGNPPPTSARGIAAAFAYTAIGIRRTLITAGKVGRFKHLLLFLVAFMIYNDGIQTVIFMATIYGRTELGLSSSVLMGTLLIIQFIAFFGALAFGRLAMYIPAKQALMITLVIWSLVVVYAYYMTTATEYFILGIAVGLAMGGSQALSRSLYGSMIPRAASGEFYGFYSVFSKFSAIWGPVVFSLINHLSGSARNAIVSLIVFFIVGLALLAFVNVDTARRARKIDLFGT